MKPSIFLIAVVLYAAGDVIYTVSAAQGLLPVSFEILWLAFFASLAGIVVSLVQMVAGGQKAVTSAASWLAILVFCGLAWFHMWCLHEASAAV